MNNKKLIYLAAILAILVAALFIGEKLGNKTPSESEMQFFPGLTEASIGTIKVQEGAKTIKIRRKGDVWVVSQPGGASPDSKAKETAEQAPLVGTDSAAAVSTGGETAATPEYPIDSASITAAIEKVIALKKNAQVSQNPEKQSIFEVDSAKGIQVELTDNNGASVGTFIIGKSGADYNSHYIRMKGSNLVYMASGGIRHAYFTDLNRWRDKKVLKFDKAIAKGITIAAKEGGMITLAHADSGNPWMIIEPIKNPAKVPEVEELLGKLSNLNATDFQDEELADSAMGFDKPELMVTVSFNNGSSRSVIFGKKNKDNKYWIKTDGKEQIFLIGEYYFNQLNKKLDDLKGEALVKPVNPDTLK